MPILSPRRRSACFYPDQAEKASTSQGGASEADARTRTGDPFITSEVLYQLSYVGGARLSLATLFRSDRQPVPVSRRNICGLRAFLSMYGAGS